MLDTHVLLWVTEDRPFEREVRSVIADPGNEKWVSAATIWEIAIKRASGRLPLDQDPARAVEASGFDSLPISFDHAERAGALPSHHGDPFDRMLVAQAQLEGLTLVTADRLIQRYDVPVLIASAS